MKICILTHTFPRFDKDTAAPFMDGVADGIASRGNNVFVLTPYSPEFKRRPKKGKYKLVTYKYAPFDSWHKLGYSETLTDDKNLKISGYFLSPLMFVFGIISLYKLVKKEGIDIINAHWILPNGFIASIVSKLTGVPVVSTLPGSDVYMADKNSLFRYMARFSSEISKAITSNSPQLLSDLAKICEKNGTVKGVIERKSFSIVYGVDPTKFYPTNKLNSQIRRSLEIPNGALLISSVGRLVSKKGYKYLIRAAKEIVGKDRDVFFVIFGEGDHRKELENLINRLNIKDNFKLPGSVKYNEMLYYQNVGDVFILPSVRDEKGNLDDQSVSVVEAMSCGKPILTTDFPGYRLVVKGGKSGYLVGEKDIAEIVRMLKKLIKSSSLRKKMGRESRKYVLEKLSWKAIGKQYNDLFIDLLK